MKSTISTVEEIIKRLPIIRENIFAEAAEMPKLFIDAARYRVRQLQRRSSAELELEALDASLSLRVRARLSGDKPTEGTIKANVATNKKIMAAKKKLAEAEAREEFSKLLIDTCRMRRDGIRVIAEAQIYEGVRENSELKRLEERRKLGAAVRNLDNKRKRFDSE